MPAHRDIAHHFWRGELASYHAKHAFVRRRLGKAAKCVCCGTTRGRIEWANISGDYLRDLSDYKSLCKRCHIQFDKPNWGKARAHYAPEMAGAV